MIDDDAPASTPPTTAVVSINWEGLKRFLGWQGTTAELRQLELERPRAAAPGAPAPRAVAAGGVNRSDPNGI